MLVSGWVLLGLEQGVKVPERTLNEVIGWHLCKAEESSWFIVCGYCQSVWLQKCKTNKKNLKDYCIIFMPQF